MGPRGNEHGSDIDRSGCFGKQQGSLREQSSGVEVDGDNILGWQNWWRETDASCDETEDELAFSGLSNRREKARETWTLRGLGFGGCVGSRCWSSLPREILPPDLLTIETLRNKPCSFDGVPSFERSVPYTAGKGGGVGSLGPEGCAYDNPDGNTRG